MSRLEPGFSDRRTSGFDANLETVDAVLSRDREGFVIGCGYNDDLVDRLIAKSRQEHIVEHCPRDSAERFVSRESFNEWHEKDGGRAPYFLMDASGDLAGLVWYGRSEMDESDAPHLPPELMPNHTFAIRIYSGFQGRGLAEDFIKKSMRDYLEHLAGSSQFDDFNGFHLETDRDNAEAIRLYEAIGYQSLEPAEDSERIIMILSPEDALRFIDDRQTS